MSQYKSIHLFLQVLKLVRGGEHRRENNFVILCCVHKDGNVSLHPEAGKELSNIIPAHSPKDYLLYIRVLSLKCPQQCDKNQPSQPFDGYIDCK